VLIKVSVCKHFLSARRAAILLGRQMRLFHVPPRIVIPLDGLSAKQTEESGLARLQLSLQNRLGVVITLVAREDI
jgi:hypothetical protein